MKRFCTLFATLLLFATNSQAQDLIKKESAANFLVHITAFIEKRPVTYFTNLENVNFKLDNKGIWHYFVGAYKTLEEAETVKKDLISRGYPYAYVLDVEKTRRECKAQCESEPTLDLPNVSKSIRSLTNILFDFNKSYLTNSAKEQLDNLSNIMTENNAYKVDFKGHCDAIGTPEYNQELSEKRSEAAKMYVNNKGIMADRLTTSSYGMDAPIAKNSKNGKDCPEGRKYNRRVELFIMDKEGNVLNALITPFDIPTDLMYEGPRMKYDLLPKEVKPANKALGMN